MGKLPSFQFYPRDWISDPQLKKASFQTKGVWIDLLCYLWESPTRGTITGTVEEIQNILGCNANVTEQFLREAKVTNFADVTISNGIVTVTNRRMVREEKERSSGRYRMEKFREREKLRSGNEEVTPPSSSSSSTSRLKEGPLQNVTPQKITPRTPKDNPDSTTHLWSKCHLCGKETRRLELSNGMCVSCRSKEDLEKNLPRLKKFLQEIEH